jgi:hypothetical protein
LRQLHPKAEALHFLAAEIPLSGTTSQSSRRHFRAEFQAGAGAMKLAIMQPYFLPYIGYWQLIAAVDVFLLYDNIQYTKKGWINRNRLLKNGSTDATFSLPLKKGGSQLDIVERELTADFNCTRLLNRFKGVYGHAPYFAETWPLLERIVCRKERNLFRYLHHSIVEMCTCLGLETEIRISSEVAIDHSLKGQDKVLALCRTLNAGHYINAIGGMNLYDRNAFRAHGIELKFLRAKPFAYPQFGASFVPWLSIVDVLMFNTLEQTRAVIREGYDLITPPLHNV